MATSKLVGAKVVPNPTAMAGQVPEKPPYEGPNIGFVRGEVTSMFPKWELVGDCLKGQLAVKERGEKYLPKVNPADESLENDFRNAQYLERAIFYNFVGGTLRGLIGQVFSRDPEINLPDERMKKMIMDVDGNGVTLDQLAEHALGSVMGYGRCGILADYPVVEGITSLADQEEGNVRPTISYYGAGSIINWRTKARGARQIYTLLVLRETFETSNDGFEIQNNNRWRVLRLDANDNYTWELWQEDEDNDGFLQVTGPTTALDANGKPLTEIPFFPIGVLNNNITPDEPPLYDMAVINVGHYRNSADYEDSCYMVGQPTPYFAGLTVNWWRDVFQGKPIQMGSRGAVALPAGGTAGLLQVNENSMTREAMQDKQAVMAMLGARIISRGDTSQTLGESQSKDNQDTSILARAAKNVSDAFIMALRAAASFIGVDSEEIVYNLNTDFPAARLTPNERAQLVQEWTAGLISLKEARANLRRGGVASQDMEEFKAAIKADPPPVQVKAEQDAAAAAANNFGKGGANNTKKTANDTKTSGGNQTGN